MRFFLVFFFYFFIHYQFHCRELYLVNIILRNLVVLLLLLFWMSLILEVLEQSEHCWDVEMLPCYVVILYLETLPIFLLLFSCFLVESFLFPISSIMSFVIIQTTWVPLFPLASLWVFFFLVVLDKSFKSTLINNNTVGHSMKCLLQFLQVF